MDLLGAAAQPGSRLLLSRAPGHTGVVAKSLAASAAADCPNHLQPSTKKNTEKIFSTCGGARRSVFSPLRREGSAR